MSVPRTLRVSTSRTWKPLATKPKMAARDLLADRIRGGLLPESATFEIVDDSGTVLEVVRFEDAYSRI
jgi:hypothetical protein